MSEPKKTGLDLLREPFPLNQISKLPKPMKKREEMDKLPKATCKICNGYHATSMMMHLDYVGHAALTDRLLDCDPSWEWHPLALDSMGYPALDKDGGMWIRLTVCGVTRYGYGDAQGKTGGDAMKERIGDALRNGAMRFGAALDLWHKGDLHTEPPAEDMTETPQQPPPPPPQAPTAGPKDAEATLTPQETLQKELAVFCHDDELEMFAVLKEVTKYTTANGDKWMTPKDLLKPSDNEKFQKWCGSGLGKLRKMPKDRQPGEDDL